MELAIIEGNRCTNRVVVPDDWTDAEGEYTPPAGATFIRNPSADIPIGAEFAGEVWRLPAETAAEAARRMVDELQQMQAITTVLLVRLIERLRASDTLTNAELQAISPQAKAAFQRAQVIANQLDPNGA